MNKEGSSYVQDQFKELSNMLSQKRAGNAAQCEGPHSYKQTNKQISRTPEIHLFPECLHLDILYQR